MSEQQYLKINVAGMRLAHNSYDEPRPKNSIWPRKELKISRHTLDIRIKDEVMEWVTEEQYQAFLNGDPWPPVEKDPAPAKEESSEEKDEEDDDELDEDDDEDDDWDEEEEETEPPGPQFEPTRDGLTLDEYWDYEDHKVKDAWGSVCPFCNTRHRTKIKLWDCCKDQSEFVLTRPEEKQTG